ncbi:MAG: 1-deoxy-D-xylulose-5-phosphate synthase [Bifidobacteriaceae bacterium]|jgi:1-deoxy-D-xylulose-5-phosphate synthase|nr:1-deoxy-D-xylulose-5-phosphate synthase [Bifidobacteriaceae bacterium]
MLEKINSPEDLKKIPLAKLSTLCDEIRQFLIDVLSQTGGHVAPNLGIVEATVALHWVFESPTDKIIFDVSHQSYVHKILTGRKDLIKQLHNTPKINGYTDFSESEHDFFRMGHTSTSISLATGLAKARDLQGRNYNVVSLIGDGALSGGEAFEGFNNGANLKSNFIVIVNDNEFSIDTNSGGLYANLTHLRQTNGDWSNNYFKALGYEYFYVAEGNSVTDLVKVFQVVKDSSRPVVVHIHTKKGKGLSFAENDTVHWHYKGPFDKNTGQAIFNAKANPNFASAVKITQGFLDRQLADNKTAFVIIPGAPNLGDYLKNKYPAQYVDTGIAEEQAVAMMSGAAKVGAKPYLYVSSPFIQRAYDQIIIDWAVNQTPGVMLVAWAGISGGDYTHVGMYDIAMLAHIPALTYITPASDDEYKAMLEFSTTFNKPLAIRLGSGNLPRVEAGSNQPIELGKWAVTQIGSQVAILGLGEYFIKGQQVAQLLQAKGIISTVINPRFINILDKKLLQKLVQNHKIFITLENGIVSGGFGQIVAGYLSSIDAKIIVKNYGAKREFINNELESDIMNRYHLNPEQIVEDIERLV